MFDWKRLRYSLEIGACEILERVIPALPRPYMIALANFLGDLAFSADRRGRRVALENLRCAFRGAAPGEEEALEIIRDSYRNFLRTMLDLFWAARLNRQNFREWMFDEGGDEVRARMAQENRGACFVTIHYGCWEWASLYAGFLGIPFTAVAEPMKNPGLAAIFDRRRSHSGVRVLPQEQSLVRMLKASLRKEVTGLVADLTIPPSGAATITEAFGLKHCVPALQLLLAHRTGVLLVPVVGEPQPDGRVKVIVGEAVEVLEGESLAATGNRLWKVFEGIIRSRPGLWLWSYKHFRYRPRGTEPGVYPAYSNESGAFERVLRRVATEEKTARK
jgi:KDO2-lipid IV(A) lauroyltransferase